MLDERSYRGPNCANRQTSLDDSAAFLGPAQLRWLKRALRRPGDVEGDRKRHADRASSCRI